MVAAIVNVIVIMVEKICQRGYMKKMQSDFELF